MSGGIFENRSDNQNYPNTNKTECHFFAIAMPVYNRGSEFIERAINCVLNQSFEDWILCIVDDNSDESERVKTRLIQNKYEHNKKIWWFYHSENMGANVARNTAIRETNSKYLAFLDSDDEWDEKYLERIAVKLIGDKTIGLISTSYFVCHENGLKTLHKTLELNGNIYTQELERDLLSPTSAIVASREIINTIGGFDESLPARQDYDTWIRMFEKGCLMENIQEPLVIVHREGHESISSSYQRHIDGTKIIYEKILTNKHILPSLKNKACGSQLSYISSIYASKGELIVGFNYLIRSLSHCKNPRAIYQYLRGLSIYIVKKWLPINVERGLVVIYYKLKYA